MNTLKITPLMHAWGGVKHLNPNAPLKWMKGRRTPEGMEGSWMDGEELCLSADLPPPLSLDWPCIPAHSYSSCTDTTWGCVLSAFLEAHLVRQYYR